MNAFLIALWARVPPKARAILAAIIGIIAAAFTLFFLGKRKGVAQGQAQADLTHAREDADRVRGMAAAGDDAGVQRELADATEKAKKVTGK